MRELDNLGMLLFTTSEYIKYKKQVTACRQAHFKQLCSRCPEYADCRLYSEYIDSWMKLQEVVNEIGGTNEEEIL